MTRSAVPDHATVLADDEARDGEALLDWGDVGECSAAGEGDAYAAILEFANEWNQLGLEAVYVEQCPIYIEDDHLPIDVRRDCCHAFPCGVQVMTPPMLLPCRWLRLSRSGSLRLSRSGSLHLSRSGSLPPPSG